MRVLVHLFLIALLFTHCNRTTSKSSDTNPTSVLIAYQDYKPNPDEVVISAKLLDYESGKVSAEVINQLKIGFSAKVVLNAGEKIELRSDQRPPADSFICALEVKNTMKGNSYFKVIKYLK